MLQLEKLVSTSETLADSEEILNRNGAGVIINLNTQSVYYMAAYELVMLVTSLSPHESK